MRADSFHMAAPPRRIAANALPALAGSLAVLMTAAPAHAVQQPERSVAPIDLGALTALDRATLSSAATLRVTTTAPDTYEVQPGDTVSAIAARNGLRTADVLAINGLSASSIIYPGQTLRLIGAVPEGAPAASAPTGSAHVVSAGETISAIAARYGLSVQSVLTANGLEWSSVIYPGQSIAIPGATSPAAPPVPAAPAAPAATETAGTYVVVSGDTISGIARQHGTSTQAVLSANGLDASSIIYPGQTLSIPVSVSPVLAAQTAPAPASSGLDAEQAGNAALIIQIGRELGIPDRGIAIALGTAMQESWLRNLDWGDRDSLGLFQQRPSSGWGTPEQVRDPARAVRVFYGGPADPNGTATRGLLDIPGWQDMSYADAAQAVQISAYPERYAQWEQPAYAWLAAHG